jgi:hypothetical protein
MSADHLFTAAYFSSANGRLCVATCRNYLCRSGLCGKARHQGLITVFFRRPALFGKVTLAPWIG